MPFFGTGSYRAFTSRLRYSSSRPGHGRWLLTDHDTEHVVEAAAPSDAVHATVRRLDNWLTSLPTTTCRKAAKKLGVYEPAQPQHHDTRQAAITTVSRTISQALARHHEALQEHFGGRDHFVHTVALFGHGSGILFQRTGQDSSWFEQQCFLLDTRASIYFYVNFDR